jgi:hypothetical protein
VIRAGPRHQSEPCVATSCLKSTTLWNVAVQSVCERWRPRASFSTRIRFSDTSGAQGGPRERLVPAKSKGPSVGFELDSDDFAPLPQAHGRPPSAGAAANDYWHSANLITSTEQRVAQPDQMTKRPLPHSIRDCRSLPKHPVAHGDLRGSDETPPTGRYWHPRRRPR